VIDKSTNETAKTDKKVSLGTNHLQQNETNNYEKTNRLKLKAD